MAGPDRRDPWPSGPPVGGSGSSSRRDINRPRPDGADYGDPRRDYRSRDRRHPPHAAPYPRGPPPPRSQHPSPRDHPPRDYPREAGPKEGPAWKSPPPKDRSQRRGTPPYNAQPDRSKRQRLEEAAPETRPSTSPRPAPASSSGLTAGLGMALEGGVLSEVRRLALAKFAEQDRQDKQPSPSPAQASIATEAALSEIEAELDEGGEEREPGEVPIDPLGGRAQLLGGSRRTPIVWQPSRSSKQEAARRQPTPSPLHVAREEAATLDKRSRTPTPIPAASTQPDIMGSGQGKTAADLALEELGAFDSRDEEEGIDPDAPAAMKASPSGSDDSGGAVGERATDVGEAPDSAREAAAGALKSRWLADAEDEQEEGAEAEAKREAAELAALNAREREELDSSPQEVERVEDETTHLPVMRVVSMLNQCRDVNMYEKLNMISQGTYGIVYRAREKQTDALCALKKVKIPKDNRDGFPLTALREVNVLLSLYHPNIVNVTEVVVGTSLDSVFMVMEFMDHELKALMEEMPHPFSTSEVKCLLRQLLEGVEHLHDNWVIHRDLKTSNILYNNAGELKICDFGLARQFGSPLRAYTHNVVTLYYRAPELLLGGQGMKYSTAVDMWSVGCIMAELLTKEVLFPAKGELDALDLMWKLLGSPTEESWPGHKTLPNARKINWSFTPIPSRLQERFPRSMGLIEQPGSLSENGFDLLQSLLTLNPDRRISAADALQHPWFTEHPMPKDKRLMPTFQTKQRNTSGTQRRHKHAQPSPDPRLAARAAEVGSLFDRPVAPRVR